MKGVKIGTLFLVAIMSLAGVGASYAAWTERVDIGATVVTGYMDFQIEDIFIEDADGATITRGWTDAYHWWISISGTYPGWKGYVTVKHKNAGTVPIKFESFMVDSLTGYDYTIKNAYTLKFYPPGDPTTPNIYGTLWDFQTKQYYEGGGPNHWSVPAAAITLAQNQIHSSLISLELADITGYESQTVTFIFQMWAIQA